MFGIDVPNSYQIFIIPQQNTAAISANWMANDMNGNPTTTPRGEYFRTLSGLTGVSNLIFVLVATD